MKRVAPHILSEPRNDPAQHLVEARLIDDLLDVTAIIRGKPELNRQPVDAGAGTEHAMWKITARAVRR